ncbi:NAD(P)/FAD-dependent oxidoreductase [Micromonospora sp. LAH09]|uniref:NAD(P)/FAD-dependent oxidoreductase n=1 Tax=Micromonospora cabrerizensis TaxID=2911213 RepID=UPI001EE93AB6|nr:NAD(P)/FAD-dependent oxidoreductase [Micromonospora cabrerizensis]MCG5469920.1 NAD(P)/FAD-dependent oxidoreductase [Micromonospora cabrerizensis]
MARPRIVIVGAGFAGFHAARRLARVSRGAADVVLVNPTDYFLYLPLLPEVSGGVLDPRRVTVPLADTLPGVQVILGEVDGIDVDGRTLSYVDPEGRSSRLSYHRLVLAAGSVNKLLPIPGVADHAHGFRGIPEAVYLRERLIQQIELADATDDPAEREARCTFVVVGAGYTGTEVAAQGQLFTDEIVRHHPRLDGIRPRWLLLDTADRVLPGLADRMSRVAERVLRERGIEVCLGTSVAEAAADGVHLSDGRFVPSRTLVWCVGVRPDPLVEATGLPTTRGRVTVDEYLTVPGHPEILACGDAAAVPDPARPGEITPMTAQHAVRQGRLAADNIAASYGVGRRRPYRHRDLGFVVDLGGWQATANPLHVPLSGLPARVVARGYHLLSLPANRARTAADWLFAAVGSRPSVQLGLVPDAAVPLDTAAPELVRR